MANESDALTAVNPASGAPLARYPLDDEAAIARRLEQAERTFAVWRQTSFAQRAALMRKLAERLRDERQPLAELMADEMGKPIRQGRAEVDKCAWVCEFYADRAAEFLAPQTVETDAARSFVRFDPLGPVLAVMPWNFPLWQVFRFAAPGLMAGNVGLLKHAANVPGCAEAIERLFAEAGFPEGAFAALRIRGEKAAQLIGHPTVRAVTLTGSVAAGRAIAAEAGKHLKKTVLELGGSDPCIVLADADPVAAADIAVKSRMINTGQSCIAAKRFIVVQDVLEAFTQAFVEKMAALVVGDPRDEATDLGPLAREDLLTELHDQVERSVQQGAQAALGGHRLQRPGFFYAPTVLTDVQPGMAAFDEETFGPVAAIIRARDAQHAVELANQSEFGLGASLMTADLERAAELAAEIEAGCVFVNELVKSDPRLPFGGVKHSGYGRELADFGIREFVNIKSVALYRPGAG